MMKKRIRSALTWVGVLLFLGGAVVALVQTSVLWGAVATGGLVLSAVFGNGDGGVDYPTATQDAWNQLN